MTDAPKNKTRYDWQESALCGQTDPDAFFTEKNQAERGAKAICVGACTVRLQCLQFALAQEEQDVGLWGGYSQRKRQQAKKVGMSAAQMIATVRP